MDIEKLVFIVSEKRVDEAAETSSIDAAPAETPSVDWKAGKQEWIIIGTLFIISFMAALDATVLVPALPIIAYDLHGSSTSTFWAGTSYLLANAVMQPFIAALSDIFGRREFLFLSILLFTIGSVICCLAQNFTQLLTGRSVQGVGGGGIIVLVLVIMTDIIPLRQRPKYNTVIQLAWAVGTILGPLIGGAIAQNTTWRWIFYINFPFCGLGLGLVPFVLKLEIERTSLRQKLARVDWFGGTVFIASMTSFLMAITWGGVDFPWRSYKTVVPLVLGAGGVFLAIAWEKWGAKQPFLRVMLFDSRSAILTYTCSLLQGLILFESFYYISYYFESVKSMTPTLTGVALLPLSCTFVPTSVIVGLAMTKTGTFRWALWSGFVMITLGNGLLILFDTHTSTVRWALILAVIGVAHGLTINPLLFSLQAMAKTEDVAHATALYAFLRQFGQSIGVAIGGAAFQNSLAIDLTDVGLPASIAANAEGYVTLLKSLPVGSPMRVVVEGAYTLAFRGVWEVILVISVGCLVLSMGVKHFSLDRHYKSLHVLRTEGKN